MVSSFLHKELISRSSGFIMLPQRILDHPPSVAISSSPLHALPVVTVAHSLRPHRWRRLFPNDDWLRHLEGMDSEISVRIDAVDAQGAVARSWPARAVYFHEALDMAAVKCLSPDFPGELAALSRDFEAGGALPQEMCEDDTLQSSVELLGVQVDHPGSPEERFFAHRVRGSVSHHSPNQVFIRAEQPLHTGMCGGAVLDAQGRLVGMLEGVINAPPASAPQSMQQLVAGQGAAIRRIVIEPFLQLAQKWAQLEE